MLCAALAEGTSHITNIEYSKDIRATLGAAAQLGAKITEEAHSVTIKGHGTAGGFVTVTRPVFCNESGSTLRFMIPLFSLTAQKVRFTGAGRLFDRPQAIYQMLGCFCSGETVIRNAGRLRLKESDRIEAMQTELRKMGARIEVDGDTVHIQGVALHAPNAPLSGHNDHRIVMALAVAAIASGLPALLCGAEAVDKSWPAFWSVLRGLGAKVELNTDKQEEFDIKA